MSEATYVADADAASFQSRVIDASHRVPVLVDFWAAWCGPCRALAPILEKLAHEFQGRFLVVKIDTDQEQEVARRFGIRSLPTVKLFKAGAVVDEFLGAQAESQVRALLERHVARESDDARVEAAQLRGAGQSAQARELLEQAYAADPGNHRIVPDLLNVLVELNELEAARNTLSSVPANVGAEVEVQKAAARLSFAEIAAAGPTPEALTRAIDENSRDCNARYQLGATHMVRAEYEAALEQFIEIVRIDRRFRDDAGRKALLSAFELIGSDDPLVNCYRARMSSLLY